MATSNIHARFYSGQGLKSLFLMCALPLHIWTFVLAFRDFSWISDQTNSWGSIGVLSYGLVYALIESIALFIFIAILGFLVSKKWEENRRITLLSVLAIIISIWAMVSNLYFLMEISPPPQVINIFIGFTHPLRSIYAITISLLASTFLIPSFLILQLKKPYQFIKDGLDRLSLLMTLYLFFDFAALIVILIRNIRG